VVQGCVLYVTKDGIFSITVESSTQAMILKAPSQARQLSLSMPSISPTSGLKDPSGCLVSRQAESALPHLEIGPRFDRIVSSFNRQNLID